MKVCIWRRIHTIPFNKTIDLKDQDPGLEVKLREEWPRILAWAVGGCLAWRNSGLRPPGAVVDATKDYREEQDAVRRFIDDGCESLRDAFAPAAALLTAYLKWCEGEGEKPVSTKPRSTDLRAG